MELPVPLDAVRLDTRLSLTAAECAVMKEFSWFSRVIANVPTACAAGLCRR